MLLLDRATAGTDGDAVRRLTAVVLTRLRQRSGVLLVATVLVMVAASVVTHLAAAGEASGAVGAEGGEGAAQGAVLVPPVLGPLGALLLLGVAWLVRRRALRPAWFLLLPPAAFGLQELAERLFHAESLPLVGPEPSLLATLLVQLPFAVLAFVLAHLLRAAIRRVVEFLKVPTTAPVLRAAVPAWPLPPLAPPNFWALAGEHLGRGPPQLR
jgi:hypothetical protein